LVVINKVALDAKLLWKKDGCNGRQLCKQIRRCKTPDYVIDKLKSGIQQWQENQGEVE
jgi:hypothetical protein